MSQEKQTYEGAYRELQQIMQDLQSEIVSVDELGEKVKRANELLEWCRTKLRETEDTLEDLFGETE